MGNQCVLLFTRHALDHLILPFILADTSTSHHIYISFNIFLYVEDVDSKYMSIYKEEKNKKDCFEHLISLQDCDHRFHANAECATHE